MQQMFNVSTFPYGTLRGVLTVSVKKIAPEVLWQFFQNGWEFFDQILYSYYAFPTTPDYQFFCSINCNFDEVMPY